MRPRRCARTRRRCRPLELAGSLLLRSALAYRRKRETTPARGLSLHPHDRDRRLAARPPSAGRSLPALHPAPPERAAAPPSTRPPARRLHLRPRIPPRSHHEQGSHRSDRSPLLGPEAPPPQTRRHHPQPPRQPPPPDRRHPTTRLQLRPLRHARPRDPATASAGVRRVAAATAADEGGGEGGATNDL